ncbi:MAG: cell division ATP-binding protein FtsE [Gammaproteobacteria bacterium]|nr:cell division ATP-binding protein FtsE [Gammaproteobacteria bacterium]
MGSVAFRNVTKRFPNGHEALKDVTVAVAEGTMAFIRGHSGAGKTTFLRLLLGIESPTRGQVVVNGVDIAKLSRRRLPRYRQHLGAVFQDPRLLMHRTVFENVALPLRVTGTGERDIGRRVRPALERVGLLEKEAHLPVFLSAGERQRVGIARAVVNRPKVLLADEPTGNLDPHLSRDVMRLFLDFHRVGTTVIVASHDHGLIESLGMRVIELDHGTLAGEGERRTGSRG